MASGKNPEFSRQIKVTFKQISAEQLCFDGKFKILISRKNSRKFVYFQATTCKTPFILTNFFIENLKFHFDRNIRETLFTVFIGCVLTIFSLC